MIITIRKMQVKRQWAITLHLLEWLLSKKVRNKYWWGCGQKETLCALLVGRQIGTTTMENIMEVPQKIKNTTTIWCKSTSGYLCKKTPKHLKRYMHNTFIAALFTTAKVWKQPKCPLIHERIKMMQYIYTKRNTIQP